MLRLQRYTLEDSDLAGVLVWHIPFKKGVDVFDQAIFKDALAARVIVAEVQDDGLSSLVDERPPACLFELVLGRDAIEAAARVDRDAVGFAHPLQLWHHASRLTVDADAHLLTGELVALVGAALVMNMLVEGVLVGVVRVGHDRDAMVADVLERN